MRACVESGARVLAKQPLPHFVVIFRDGFKRERFGPLGTAVLCGQSHVTRSSWGCPQPEDKALTLISMGIVSPNEQTFNGTLEVFTNLPMAGNCLSIIIRSIMVPYDR